jgi:hypothetical protein
MSHFTVMVFGDDVEAQLAPFHQFECTGENDEYVIDEDVTEDIQERIDDGETIGDALGWYGLNDKVVEDESEVDTEGYDCEHKYGYAIVKDGKLIKAVNRTNPTYHWDWYQIGGRWSGFLKLKEGATGENGERSWCNSDKDIDTNRCDSALKRDIDIEGMRDAAGEDAGNAWDEIHRVVGDITWESWDSVRERIFDIDEAREFYNEQPALLMLRTAGLRHWGSTDEYLVTREEYVTNARNRAISTFAVLKDGEWIEKGEMGWFGMSTDTVSQVDWDVVIGKLIDSVSDDTRITIVDAHI